MNINENTTETLARTPSTLPKDKSRIKDDASAWAGLLDEYLGPENDIYARLLKKGGARH